VTDIIFVSLHNLHRIVAALAIFCRVQYKKDYLIYLRA